MAERTVEQARGVYTITNEANGKVYVGSAVNVRRRWAAHRRELRRGVHPNRYLQASWRKHGEGAFSFAVVEFVGDPALLAEREQAWMDSLRSSERSRGFNLSPTAYSILGYRFNDDQRRNVSDAASGKPKTAEHRARLWANRCVTDEFRQAMAAAGRTGAGRPKSPKHRRAIGAAQQGSANHAAKLTEEAVRQIRARLSAGETGRSLAAEFGVHESIVSEIKSGRRWRHVT